MNQDQTQAENNQDTVEGQARVLSVAEEKKPSTMELVQGAALGLGLMLIGGLCGYSVQRYRAAKQAAATQTLDV